MVGRCWVLVLWLVTWVVAYATGEILNVRETKVPWNASLLVAATVQQYWRKRFVLDTVLVMRSVIPVVKYRVAAHNPMGIFL
jgi:hypothetical protein